MNKIMSSEEIAKEYDGVLYNNKWVDKELLQIFVQNLILTDYAQGSKLGEDWFLERLKESIGMNYEELMKND